MVQVPKRCQQHQNNTTTVNYIVSHNNNNNNNNNSNTKNIQQLPEEVLEHIFDYLSQSTIIHNISLLSHAFYSFTRGNACWLNRVVIFTNSRWNSQHCYQHDVFYASNMMMESQCPRVYFSYLKLEDIVTILSQSNEFIRSLQVHWCESPFFISDELLCSIENLSFPHLERIQIGYYYSGKDSAITQVFRHILANSPRLKYLNGVELPLLSYGSSLIKWEQLKSVTLMHDRDSSAVENDQILTTISPKLGNNLTHLDLRAQYFDAQALQELFRHTARQLRKLDIYDLFSLDLGTDIKMDQLTELTVSRSERAVCNLVKSTSNIKSLQLDRSSSYEIASAAYALKNLQHLAIERYTTSLVEIMRHCSLRTLKISHMDMDEKTLKALITCGVTLETIVMDHIKFPTSEDLDMLLHKLPNLKEFTANVCHSAVSRGPIADSLSLRYGVTTFNYQRSRMGLDISSFATPNLRDLTYQKAMREKTFGIRLDDFYYLTNNCPKLKSLDMSLFDISYTTNSRSTKFNIFPELETCRLVFGEFASLAHLCCVIICCRNATNFAIDSITCKASYIDGLRTQLLNEIRAAAIKTARPARPTTCQPSPLKKLKRGCDQRTPKPKKSSHSHKGTCNLKHLAKIVWGEMDKHVFGPYQFFDTHGRNVTDELRKFYKAELLTRYNPKLSNKNTSLLHQFLHVLQFRVLSNDIPKKMLIYGPHVH